jgi:hypothetical protein
VNVCSNCYLSLSTFALTHSFSNAVAAECGDKRLVFQGRSVTCGEMKDYKFTIWSVNTVGSSPIGDGGTSMATSTLIAKSAVPDVEGTYADITSSNQDGKFVFSFVIIEH